MAKILVIDDEPSIVNLVTAYLKPEGYEIYTAMDGPSGLKAARVFKPDLIILDIMLPGMDGIELLSHLRRESEVYVIILTARTEETNKIVGLSVGADDYVTKPFSPRELVARVKAALRRIQSGVGLGAERSVLSFEHICIDVGARTTSVDDHPLELTARIVILTTFGRSGYLRQAMESGAVGFLLKDAPADQLAVAIRRVMAGERVVDPDLALSALSDGDNPLTGRERDVLLVSLNGTSIADIATQFYLSEGTVRNHISTAIQKLHAQNRMEAARLAQEKGWL